jgi:hypothetical protein
VEELKEEVVFGEWDEVHTVYSPDERLNDGELVDGGSIEEYCPFRRTRIRDNIHNLNHPSCTYYCHHGH